MLENMGHYRFSAKPKHTIVYVYFTCVCQQGGQNWCGRTLGSLIARTEPEPHRTVCGVGSVRGKFLKTLCAVRDGYGANFEDSACGAGSVR